MEWIKEPQIVLSRAFLARYTASKFAVVGFTKAAALELAPLKTNVNCVCPGFVNTSMMERELEWESKLRGTTPQEVKNGFLAQIPLGRLATLDDVARIVAFLCSHDADYMTGQAVNVTGGAMHVLIYSDRNRIPKLLRVLS